MSPVSPALVPSCTGKRWCSYFLLTISNIKCGLFLGLISGFFGVPLIHWCHLLLLTEMNVPSLQAPTYGGPRAMVSYCWYLWLPHLSFWWKHSDMSPRWPFLPLGPHLSLKTLVFSLSNSGVCAIFSIPYTILPWEQLHSHSVLTLVISKHGSSTNLVLQIQRTDANHKRFAGGPCHCSWRWCDPLVFPMGGW